MDREQLYERIDARVDQMLADGVQEEVRRARGAGASDTARKALGFEDLLSGDIEQMKRRTRNYARRQLTWMRKLAGVTVIDRTGRSAEDVAARDLRRLARRALRRRRAGPGRARAQNAATNGYMSTTATSTPNAHTPMSPRSHLRPGRHAQRRRVGGRDVDARHHDHHVVEVAGALVDQAEHGERHPRADEPAHRQHRQLLVLGGLAGAAAAQEAIQAEHQRRHPERHDRPGWASPRTRSPGGWRGTPGRAGTG